MTEEEMKERIIKLEGEVRAAAEALKLAYANTHGIRAEIIAVLAALVSIYALFR